MSPPVDYIRIEADVLRRTDLSDKAKMLLALVTSMNGQGVHMRNGELADALGTSERSIDRTLTELRAKGCIRCDKAQSKHRKIYSAKNGEVEKSTPPNMVGYSTENGGVESGVYKEELNKLNNARDVFEIARKAYPGTKRGLDAEYDNFRKKCKDWRQVVGLLLPAIEREKSHKARMKAQGAFCPAWKHFQTWINQACWTTEFPEEQPATGDYWPQLGRATG